MATGTRTSTEAAVLEVRAGGAVAELRRGPRLAPRILGRDAAGALRAAFVPTQAGPLAGDRDRVRIVVGAGAVLVVEPVAATLALPGAERTLLELELVVRSGGRLVLDEGPLIVAAGATVRRRCAVQLDAGAVALLREVVVLGRDGEPPGTLDAVLRVTYDGAALLHDALRLGPGGGDAHVALAPGHRVVATVCMLGERPPADAPPASVHALAGPGALLRCSGATLATVESRLAATWASWSRRSAAPPAPEPSAEAPDAGNPARAEPNSTLRPAG